jgi:hypothetical protein
MINFGLLLAAIVFFVAAVGFLILALLAKANHNQLVDIYNELAEIHKRHNPHSKYRKVGKL